MKSTLIGDFILQIPEIKTEIRHPRTPDGTDSGTGFRLAGSDAKAVVG